MTTNRKKDYLPDTPVAFQEIKVYVGTLREELLRSLDYYMYVCYGKNYRQSERYVCIEFLIDSLNMARNTHINFAKDIKNAPNLYKKVLHELILLVNDAQPHKTDEFSLNIIISFHKDMEKVLNTVMKSKRSFKN